MLNKHLRHWTVPKGTAPGVNLIGPVEFSNGLGVSARAYALALIRAGVPLNVVPWRRGFERLHPLPVQYPSTDFQPINLIHLNLDLLCESRLLDMPPLNEIAVYDRYNVAIVYWELSSIVPEWFELIHRFDEIWCASSFVARSIAAVSGRPTKVVRPALALPASKGKKTREDFGLPKDRFIFFYSVDAGSILERKNPNALIGAYLEEFEPHEGACCLVKINHLDPQSKEIRDIYSIIARRPDVVFMDRILSGSDIIEIYNLIDCYVSPHRSEGLGLTILEAMNAKKPIIATPYGGVSDFINAETAILIEYRLAEVGHGNSPYPEHFVWADPIRSSLRTAMRSVFEKPQLRQSVSMKGHAITREIFSVDRTAQAIEAEIEHIWKKGQLPEGRIDRLILKIGKTWSGCAVSKYIADAQRNTPGSLGRKISKAVRVPKRLIERVLQRSAVSDRSVADNEVRISILMPVSDMTPLRLNDTIKSVIRQSYRGWELCICDNYSTMDVTVQALEKYRGVDSRIKIIRSPRKLQPTEATMLAAEFATGQFVSFIGGDGVLETNIIERFIRAITKLPNTIVVSTNGRNEEINEYVLTQNTTAQSICADIYSLIYVLHFIAIRKSVFLGLDPTNIARIDALSHHVAVNSDTENDITNHRC